MSPDSKNKLDLTKIPLAFAEGTTLKKEVRWNNNQILTAGEEITAAVISEYEDVALHILTSPRIEKSLAAIEELIQGNISEYKKRQQVGRARDLSETYAAGEVVFEQGDTENQDCYFLTEGSVQIYRDGQLLATLDKAGTPIGEMSFLSGEPRSATVTAAEPTKLLRLKRSERRKVLKHNPTLVHTLLETLVKRLNDTSQKLVEASREDDPPPAVAETATETAAVEAELAKLKKDYLTLTNYVAAEVGGKSGNRVLLEQLLNKLKETPGAMLPEGEATPLFALLSAYLDYLQAQPSSQTVEPVIEAKDIPPLLQEFLQS